MASPRGPTSPRRSELSGPSDRPALGLLRRRVALERDEGLVARALRLGERHVAAALAVAVRGLLRLTLGLDAVVLGLAHARGHVGAAAGRAEGVRVEHAPATLLLGRRRARAGGGGARVGAGAGFAPPPPNKLSKGFAGFAGGAGAGAGASSFSQGHARTTVRRGCRAGANAVAVATMSASRMVLSFTCLRGRSFRREFSRAPRFSARRRVAANQK